MLRWEVLYLYNFLGPIYHLFWRWGLLYWISIVVVFFRCQIFWNIVASCSVSFSLPYFRNSFVIPSRPGAFLFVSFEIVDLIKSVSISKECLFSVSGVFDGLLLLLLSWLGVYRFLKYSIHILVSIFSVMYLLIGFFLFFSIFQSLSPVEVPYFLRSSPNVPFLFRQFCCLPCYVVIYMFCFLLLFSGFYVYFK